MHWSIEFIPFFSWPVLWALAAFGALLFALLLWRAPRGAVLRAFSYALLLLAIANPFEAGGPRAAPTSSPWSSTRPSQKLAGRDRGRKPCARSSRIGSRSSPISTSADRRLRPRSDSDRDGTMLFADLAKGLADVPPDRLAGVIMLTDGDVHDVPGSRVARFRCAGACAAHRPAGERDRRLVVLRAPRFGLVGGEQPIEVRVTETTPSSAIRQGHRHPSGRGPIAQNVTAGESRNPGQRSLMPAQISWRSKPRQRPERSTAVNNRAVLTVEGIRENLRVLLVSGEPHAGERTWRNLLKSDAAVDLVHFTILRPPEKQDGTPINELSLIAFPTRELFSEKIDQFDLIIFDRYQHRGVLPFLYSTTLPDYVERGGAVLVSAGPDYATSSASTARRCRRCCQRCRPGAWSRSPSSAAHRARQETPGHPRLWLPARNSPLGPLVPRGRRRPPTPRC